MEADSLLSVHGDGAWEIAYGRCKDMALPDPERQRFLAVRREIERRLGMESHQQDTATRYLKQ